ncbi:unnamed protein product [Pipistrellus nathusii]|uniref:Uncharacterized protein n=1 Tax=Pipistrellus nathusii TaxID=59473 RepID=A0ABP0A7W5_PIPNA
MAAARKREREALRFVYLPRFGPLPGGGVLPRGARRAAEPRGAALPPGAGPAAAASSAGRARAGLSQKMLTKKFEFPIRSNETSKAMKKKKEVSVWKKVHKVISRMLEENEQYRLRLKCQGLSSENSDHTR